MLLKHFYDSPVGGLTLLVDNDALVGLWFDHQAHYGAKYDLTQVPVGTNDMMEQTQNWLDRYFSGEQPHIDELNLNPAGTDFQRETLRALCTVLYGQTATYQDLADIIEQNSPGRKTAARAIGGAMGHNPISIIIPCHRIIGKSGSLTGYSAGLETKIELLKLEKIVLV